eukprot:350715-Chlamydomonas_euryale.AAC.8
MHPPRTQSLQPRMSATYGGRSTAGAARQAPAAASCSCCPLSRLSECPASWRPQRSCRQVRGAAAAAATG